MTSPSDSVWCPMRIARAGILSDTRHCPMMTSKSVSRPTVPDNGMGPFVNMKLRLPIREEGKKRGREEGKEKERKGGMGEVAASVRRNSL